MSPLTTETKETRASLESERQARVAASNLRRFRPGLALGFQLDLRILAERASALPTEAAAELVNDAIALAEDRRHVLQESGLSAVDLLPTARYAATLRILRDLVIQGWDLRSDDEGVILEAPGGRGARQAADPEREKVALRHSFSFARMAQLHEPATVRFIHDMERRGITRLFAEGSELSARLETAQDIQPQLELVEAGARDELTGLLLQDVWRYARHFWSIPYQSTPGRNMFYLVRDGAVSSRPIIGIAALGNPILGLNQRDDYYGWSIRGLRRQMEQLDEADVQRLGGCLYLIVAAGISDTYSTDFWPEGRTGAWRNSVEYLEQIRGASAAERLEQLDEENEGADTTFIRKALGSADRGDIDAVDWKAIAETALYRRKRASTLADLIRAEGTLDELGFSASTGDIHRALASPDGTRAVEIALRRVKQQVITSNVMELITCGALPPYREVLGGKLVAMLMLSSEVVRDVAAKYSGRISLIASALAARPISRPARLGLITTSSLYEIGSSQYNRIKIRLENGALTYRKIGATESFGTVHFASDTVADLSSVARLANDNRRSINNLFGEGTSPKLRLVRSGLDALGLNSDTFLRHHSPRLLYAAALCSNIDRIALGLTTEPDYFLDVDSASVGFISDYWRERWLRRRASRSGVLERLRGSPTESTRLSRQLRDDGQGRKSSRAVSVVGTERLLGQSTHNQQTFIERLYRSSKSYADRLTTQELNAIHIDLGTDDYVVAEAEAGRQIIITGNPGDGKTHLIERMRPHLERLGALVITDANASTDTEILDAWESCHVAKRPFVLAINEWPLFVLKRIATSRNFNAVEEAVRQATSSRYFVDGQRPEEPKDGVIVVDLSLRDLLARPVVQKAIERLTQDQFYEGLTAADPAGSNRTMLKESQVQERLIDIMQIVSARTPHVTMRQLVGFIAFLITGGQSASARLKFGQDTESFSYYNLAFDPTVGGAGAFFEAVRAVFDPAAITHPDWDNLLWLGETDPRDWLGAPPKGAVGFSESTREAAYRAIKRRFFFEHINGRELLDLLPSDEQDFNRTLHGDRSTHDTLVRDLVLALNRFYEPDCPDSEKTRLQLWQSHRYDVRPPAAFVSLHTLPYDQLRIEPLRLASWVESWLPSEQQTRRSFGLVAAAGGRDVALLDINRDLYLTLVEAQRGLGRASWSRTAARRVTRFVDHIHRATEGTPGVQDLRIRNVESDLDDHFSIVRMPPRYQF